MSNSFRISSPKDTDDAPSERPLRRSSRRAASIAVKPPEASVETSSTNEALRPLTTTDIEEWEGWVELESEPAFFNTILQDLGVKDVKVQELFSIDQSWLDTLLKPIYGLIFLFQYTSDADESEGEDETGSLWFANQTTNNACATFALLNIVMNAPNIELGDKLREFKKETKDLNTVLRGHAVSNNKFMRSIHNSFTRRMDHLNADLCLEHAVSHTKIDGYVWELDGLRSKPHRIGPIASQETCWTNIARPQIEGRILQYEESQIAFNLLALCQRPAALHSRSIAQVAATIRFLKDQMKDNSEFADLINGQLPVLENPADLSEFNLLPSDIENATFPNAIKAEISRVASNIDEAYDLYQRLVVDLKVAIGEHRAEMISLSVDEQRVKDRKKDFGQALHRWVQKLAEKGVLEELIENS
ncbi:ubiquitin carboxyl-terminal hydrolase, family 1 domain-containing protein [Trichoderma breve]|uniref:Ubiquitin carboxyl-terminal hydrolase n=1 Tax=Trichoderma breve TaxID=2034170 RepID=A0A9W9BLZ4_9HYPO|nr:ubiquitin carboxyl-terminal hydrolase, family 1 domain-containing protein [Trichoderma breve]KAJ4862186.1 ubiquitin carboxyl-terminal hydrolase, family 1 domain-containing protein [Trichoderma breve]